MKKLLVICGPTSTGKTSLSIKLAKRFDGEIVSADSRQVYKGMDIGTGKDVPKGETLQITDIKKDTGYYEIDDVKIWGYDLVSPKTDFSVAGYIPYAHRIIDEIWGNGKLPIVTGGTGLYIKGLVEGIPTADVPRNIDLRKRLETLKAPELYEKLAELDSSKAGSMNVSDKNNPRRLVRAIEVAQYHLGKNRMVVHRTIGQEYNILYVGLTAPKNYLDDRISKRVAIRVKLGVEDEIIDLLEKGVAWEDQSMMSLGYRQWRDFFEGAVDRSHVIEEWVKEERKYVKRQMTWFNKNPLIKWFDITDSEYQKKVEDLVQKWYSNLHAEES
jgi:tRNA dimethylallyltransferase